MTQVVSPVSVQSHGGGARIHLRGNELFLEERKIVLYLTPEQRLGERVNWENLRMRLKNISVDKYVCDYLLDHPNLIPESFGEPIVFLETMVWAEGLRRYVKYLYRSEGGDWLTGAWPATRFLMPSEPVLVFEDAIRSMG